MPRTSRHNTSLAGREVDPLVAIVVLQDREVVQLITSADPECVWATLTATGRPLDFLYGMTQQSDWQVGSTVTVGLAGHPPLTGEILAVDRHETLSYTLGDRADRASVYVTWHIRSEPAGTSVRLDIDEPFPHPGGNEELEGTWLPIVSRLTAQLEGRPQIPRNQP